GFSGLSYLNKFKVDRIKIDASFIRELETSASCRSMVGTIINLGHDQGFDVTVEGVETVEQVEFLSGFKNICIQGFLFSKPLNLQDLLASPYLISENQANENGDESRYSLFQEAG
ncbi:MAG: EAL domain-containing protein, partial [Nitratireductor sp.]